MSKYLKYGLFALAGLALFLGTFVVAALLSGAPMHEVAVVGAFFPEPDEGGDAPRGAPVQVVHEDPVRSPAEAMARQAGVLGSFTMPAPFNSTDLHKLEAELKTKIRENVGLQKKLREDQLELDKARADLDDDYRKLIDLRTKLEEFEQSLELRQQELERDEAAATARAESGWRDTAAIYAAADPGAGAAMIAEESPEDAARILHLLTPEQASAILLAVEPAAKRQELMSEYRKAAQ